MVIATLVLGLLASIVAWVTIRKSPDRLAGLKYAKAGVIQVILLLVLAGVGLGVALHKRGQVEQRYREALQREVENHMKQQEAREKAAREAEASDS